MDPTATVDSESPVETVRRASAEDNEDPFCNLYDLVNNLPIQNEPQIAMVVLTQAIEVPKLAMASMSMSPDPDHASYLNILSNALQARFNMSGSIQDLSDAIQMSRRALELGPTDSVSTFRNNLGNALRIRHGLNLSPDDLNEAIHVS